MPPSSWTGGASGDLASPMGSSSPPQAVRTGVSIANAMLRAMPLMAALIDLHMAVSYLEGEV
jgi:hypothetical protein